MEEEEDHEFPDHDAAGGEPEIALQIAIEAFADHDAEEEEEEEEDDNEVVYMGLEPAVVQRGDIEEREEESYRQIENSAEECMFSDILEIPAEFEAETSTGPEGIRLLMNDEVTGSLGFPCPKVGTVMTPSNVCTVVTVKVLLQV